MSKLFLSPLLYEDAVRSALLEDIGPGDVTTESCIPLGTRARAVLLAKSEGVLAGIDLAACAFKILDPSIEWDQLLNDGDHVDGKRNIIAHVSGDARAILTAERTALKFLQQLSGVATATSRAVSLIAGTNARIIDTRKTTPGWRALQKYAVRAGGGHNHRLGLYDAVLIKDNHIRAAGGITPAVVAGRARIPHTMKIEVETKDLTEVAEALAAGADIILLDNMDLATMRQAVELINGKALTEASGGLTEERLPQVAATGVDLLSLGALTHSARAMDISLDIEL